MSIQPESEVKKHFESLDANGDGHLDLEEIKTLLKNLEESNKNNQESNDETDEEKEKRIQEAAEEMFRTHDENNDGHIDFDEFKTAWHRKLLATQEEYIKRVFDVFDDDGNGYITKDELAAVLGYEHEGELDAMLAEVDLDHDGTIRYVCTVLNEYTQYIHTLLGAVYKCTRMFTAVSLLFFFKF